MLMSFLFRFPTFKDDRIKKGALNIMMHAKETVSDSNKN